MPPTPKSFSVHVFPKGKDSLLRDHVHLPKAESNVEQC